MPMSERPRHTFDNRPVIAVELDCKCELCGTVTECRPYGPNREWVCFRCGMKDDDAAKRAFIARTEAMSKPAPKRDQ